MRGAYRKRRINRPPFCRRFRPQGIPRRGLLQMELAIDEFEAIRLTDYLNYSHLEGARAMNISRPTFTRLVERARSKVAAALVEGRELTIGGGNVDFEETLHHCRDCGEIMRRPFGRTLIHCPDCGSANVENLALYYLRDDNQVQRRKK